MNKSSLVVSRDYALIAKMKKAQSSQKERANARNELFSLYKPLVYKMRNNLIARANKTNLRIDHEVEDYEMLAFERLVMATSAIDLKKVTDPSKFFLYIQFFGYLRSLNRDLIGHRIKLYSKESQILSSADIKDSQSTPNKKNFIESHECGRTVSAEDESLLSMQRSVISKAVDYCLNKRFNELQRSIFIMREDQKSLREITSELNIKSHTYYKELGDLRKILKNTLVSMARDAKVDLELGFLEA